MEKQVVDIVIEILLRFSLNITLERVKVKYILSFEIQKLYYVVLKNY